MTTLYFVDLDTQVQETILEKSKEYNALIQLFKDGKKYYMDVLFWHTLKCARKQLISDKALKDFICIGIRKWFKNYKEEDLDEIGRR